MSTTVSNQTTNYIVFLQNIVKRKRDTHVMLSFNLLKTNLAIQKYGKEVDNHLYDIDSELNLKDKDQRLHNKEINKVGETNVNNQENSFNKDDQKSKENPDFQNGEFKLFEIEKIQDSEFSGQLNPITKMQNGDQPTQNEVHKEESDANINNIMSGTGTVYTNKIHNKDGKVKIMFKNDNIEDDSNRNVQVETEGGVEVVGMAGKGEVKVVDIKGKGDDIHLTIKEEVIINETIVTEYDDSRIKESSSTNNGIRNNTGEGVNTLLSSITHSKGGEMK